ncbi:transferase [Nostocaceae cyanobacterium CENA357]|uniref:Transferase n=1 Tax=Atlanticothrix silvestris CENA357 TaxID=1725252 RepID=A0A8J7HJG7_9CYAN|nr:transferase [Atlanticothrix silvestris]MBH8556362.1 transferase [Atlanticothrix silvestris CENA357]
MSVPPLRLSNNFDSYISGEVIIHPSAVLAPGVILQAAVNSKIVIGPGVCIGMGSILQVDTGTLEVEAGANLGAGFLMVGKGKIGTNACIGSATTVLNYSVAPGVVIPPGSLLGDTSRKIDDQTQLEPSPDNAVSNNVEKQKQQDNSAEENEDKVVSSTNLSASAFLEFKQRFFHSANSSPNSQSQSPPVESSANSSGATEEASTNPSLQNSESNEPPTESPNNFGNQIYGQGSINRLLTTLFPHRQSLNNQISDDQSE